MTDLATLGQQHFVLPLASPAATLATVGGKGANLARLACAGLPVPGGFLLTTDAYHEFVNANTLAASIQMIVQGAHTDDPASLEAASRQIRACFAAGRLPEILGDLIRSEYARIGSPPVAVRSSATAEDLPEMSFAGQQDTYLNILGDEMLLQAVVNCWSSLWTGRAIGYRLRNNVPHHDVALSVVVQQMVQSEASGVLFSANPLTGKRNEVVIDATLGLGEALVSGQVEPDHYIIEQLDPQISQISQIKSEISVHQRLSAAEKSRGRIVSKTLGAKATVIRGQTGGGTVTQQENAAQQQALPDEVILDLAALGRQVEALYGGVPQDIEWAWAEGKLFLLQARPVTSLYPVPRGTSNEAPDAYLSFGAVQGMLDPMTPLGQDAIRTIFAGAGQLFGLFYTSETQPILTSAGERLWAKLTPVLRNQVGQRFIRKVLGIIEPSIGQIVEQLVNEPAFTAQGWPQGSTILRILRLLTRVGPHLLHTVVDPDAARMAAQTQMKNLLAQEQAKMNAATTLTERVALFDAVIRQGFQFALPNLVPRIAPGLIAMNRLIALADHTFAHTHGNHRRALEIARGLPNNVTTEMDLVLWQTAKRIRGDQAALIYFQEKNAATLAERFQAGGLPATAQSAVAQFLQQYGMRGLAEIDFGRQRWSDNPIQVMQMIQSYLRIDDAQAPDVVFQRGEAASQQVIDDLIAAVRTTTGGPLKASVVLWLAKRMRALAGLRESPKFFIINLFWIVRQALLRSGEELVAQGRLERADDLFFLHYKELQALAADYAIDWKVLVAERRALYDREKLRKQIPRVLLSDGRAFYEGIRSVSGEREGLLVGSPVSPGVVEGTVHIVFDPHNAQLVPGEILVCPGTDPAWTPLFLAAGGLVMEVGGLMTHGSVVAREYGIPAVVGVHEVTTRLRTGQRIRLDGSGGTVEVLG